MAYQEYGTACAEWDNTGLDDDADEKEINMMFDLALATDVLYEIDLCGPLFTTVSQRIPVGAIFVLSHVPRAYV